MPNFFESVLKMGEHSVTQPFKAVKETFQGHPDKAWKNFWHDASGTSQDVAHSLGIRGWVRRPSYANSRRGGRNRGRWLDGVGHGWSGGGWCCWC